MLSLLSYIKDWKIVISRPPLAISIKGNMKHTEAFTAGCSFTVTSTYPMLMKTCFLWEKRLFYCYPLSSGILLSKYHTSATEEREKNLPLQWPLESMVTLLHSFDLSYEPSIIKSNKISYLEDRIIFLNNLDLDILFMKFSYLYFMLFGYSCWSSSD